MQYHLHFLPALGIGISIDWGLLGNLLIGSLPGIVLGSYLATRARDAIVRAAFAGVLLIVGVRLIG